MASISTNKSGLRRILFKAPDGERKTLHLGKTPLRSVKTIKHHVEQLAAAAAAGNAPETATVNWVADLDDPLYDKLANVGLVPERGSAALGVFLDAYIAERTDLKPGTLANLRRAQADLVAFFGADQRLREITAGDADRWRLFLLERVGENTARRLSGRARQFLRAAIRRGLLTDNPFADLPAAVQADHGRYFYVSREAAQKVLDACPDHEWRLLFGLSRFGGLRCPSEHLRLKWGHVDFANNRLIVPQPKVEHHGRATRTIPLFPELRPLLEDAAYAAQADSLDGRLDPEQPVITRYRDSRANLRTQSERIIRKAGLEPWPKPFQNLRSTRETELAEQYPLHVVVAWLGNSQPVAAKHYLQVTQEHFERAAGDGAEIVAKPQQAGEGLAEVGAVEGCVETARNPTRAMSAQPRTAAADVPSAAKTPVKSGGVREGALLSAVITTRLGFEPRMREPKSLVLPLHYRVPADRRDWRCIRPDRRQTLVLL